jgi:hypothetical protein
MEQEEFEAPVKAEEEVLQSGYILRYRPLGEAQGGWRYAYTANGNTNILQIKLYSNRARAKAAATTKNLRANFHEIQILRAKLILNQ